MILGLDVLSQTPISWNKNQGFAPFCSLLDYECSFWRQHWFMNVHFGDGGKRLPRSFLHPSFNHYHKEAFILKVRFYILYFIHVSCIQGCWKLIIKKVCDNLSFSFKLFIESLMVSGCLYGWDEALHWNSGVFSWPLDALKLHVVQFQGFDLVRCIEVILCWSFRVSSCFLSALKFCFKAPNFLIRCVETSCWNSKVSGCPLGALKFCFEAPGSLIKCVEAPRFLL